MPRTSHRVDDLSITVLADPALIHDVRTRFARWMRGWAPDSVEAREDLLVVISELLANAIAAAPHDDSELTLRACVTGDHLLLEVSNPVAPWIDPAARWNLRDPLRPGGRGLLIVSALVDDVEVVHDVGDDVTTVRCRRSLSPD